MRKSVVTVLAAAMLLGTASTAAPAAAAERATVVVPYGDLDLTDPADMATLDSRIAAAVEKVCTRVEPPRMRGLVAWEECKAKSLAEAMEEVAAIAPAPNVALAASAKD